MNKLFVSAGLVAVGAAVLESAMADSVTSPKYWNVSATLRGFYDDNYAFGPGGNQGSFGIEASPSISFHMPLQQTDIGLRYTYGMYYYQTRNDQGMNPFDQTHQVDLWVDHAFNERWHTQLNDTFAAGQEPELLQNPATGEALPYRVNGDNLSNHGTWALNTDWTRLFSTSLSYNNNFYDYDNSGAQVVDVGGIPTIVTPGGGGFGGPSLAGILNRVEESASLDLKWHLQPETTAFIGYQFGWVNYTGNEPIAIDYVRHYVYQSSDRDSMTHYGYVGLEHDFTPNLTAKVSGGALYEDNYADPISATTSWAPYADVSVAYTYLPGSYVQLGFTHDINATDQVQPDSAGNITQYAESSVVYLTVNHKITSRLTATAIGRMQYSTFQGGYANSLDETDYSLGVNLDYQVNQFLSVDAGYNYDNVQSGVPGYAFNRNRVYLGVTASY